VGEAGLDSCCYGGPTEFSRTRFCGNAGFEQARFIGPVRFDDACFERNARFNHASFEGQVSFKRTRFLVMSDFANALFGSTPAGVETIAALNQRFIERDK
jgi:hypothetical protein